MHLTRYEKETIIYFNQESDEAEVYTRDEVMMRKMDKLCDDFPDYYKCIKASDIDKEYRCPKKLVGFKRPIIMTEEQKEQAKQRGREMYEKYLKKNQEARQKEKEQKN